MLLVISSAKTLDYSNPEYSSHTQPDFPGEVKDLVGILRKKSASEISKLMHLSDSLASLMRSRSWARARTAWLDLARAHAGAEYVLPELEEIRLELTVRNPQRSAAVADLILQAQVAKMHHELMMQSALRQQR